MNKRFREEQGVTMVLFALFITAMFGIVAIVIDIAAVRGDRRENKSIADRASTAGSSDLDSDPWAAACKAYDYLAANTPALAGTSSSSFETGGGTTVPAVPDPCAASTVHLACDAADPETWARIRATSSDGKIGVDIRAGYILPDPAFPEDQAAFLVTDTGDSCLQIAVLLSEREDPKFSAVLGSDPITTLMRSVARVVPDDQQGESAALVLLERHKCDVLKAVGGSRVIVRAFKDPATGLFAPGVIQFDSAADQPAPGACNTGSPIINGQISAGGPPAILACSVIAVPLLVGPENCGPNAIPAPPALKSRIGVYAKQLSAPSGFISPAYLPPYSGGTYGDTDHIGSGLATRENVDERYREAVISLDKDAHAALCSDITFPLCTTARSVPKDCGVVTAGMCTVPSGLTWRVISGTGPAPSCANVPASIPEVRVFFECPDLNASNVDLPNASDIVITGKLTVGGGTFNAPVVERMYVLGDASGPGRGLEVATGGTLQLNRGPSSNCTGRTSAAPDATSRLVLARGVLRVRETMVACSMTVLLSSGFDKTPTTSGTAPCPHSIDNPAPCNSYSGTIDVTAGGVIDWSGPNREPTRPACPATPTCYDANLPENRLEDLSLWVEAATGNNGIQGGSQTIMSGVYFLPNADPFKLAGGGGLPIKFDAQFVARRIDVVGGSQIALTPNPHNSVRLPFFKTVLVR